MKYLVYNILLLISGLCCICSCSDKEEIPWGYEEFTTLDFGEGTYRPNPFSFLDNLPPFSWMGMPDSVKLKTTLEISFNEDAVRSNSTAKLAFINNNGKLVEGLTYNGYNLPYIELDASSYGYDQVALIPIEITVNPSIGDTVLKGSIAVIDADVDMVNQLQLSSSSQSVAYWALTQNTGINWLRWIILIIMIILILFLIWLLIKGLIVILGALIASVSGPLTIHRSRNIRKQAQQDLNKSANNRIKKRIFKLEKRLYSKGSVADKYDMLEEMRLLIDRLYQNDRPTYEEVRTHLKHNTWMALEELWTLWNPVPKSNVEWIGPGELMCRMKSSHPSFAECAKVGFTECQYDVHGGPNFSKVTFPGSVVNISKLYDSLDCDNIQKRGGKSGSFQEIAQEERMANKLKSVIKRWAKENNCEPDYWKWRDSLNLVPHEDTDCRTMRLVYRPAHTAFKHRGGVANAITVKTHFGPDQWPDD